MKDNKSATHYTLNQRPESVQFLHGESQYKTLVTGETMVQIDGIWFPSPGSPMPETLTTLHFLAFVHRNAKWIPAAVLGTVLIVLLHIALLATAGAEFAAGWLQTFSAVMNTVLLLLAAITLAAYVISQFKKGLTIDLELPGTKQLMPGGTDSISISPDVAIFSESEDELPDVYSGRVKAAVESEASWVLVLPFRSEYGAIHTGGDPEDGYGLVFLRSNPPHDGGEAITFEDAKAARQIYARERWADYVAYCAEFAKRYSMWATTAKIQNGENPIGVILRRTGFLVFAMCSCLLSVSAQKSAQVRTYLGEMRYTQDAPTGEVDFVFQSRVYTRNGQGSKPYGELLTSAPGYKDADDSGRLIGITVDNKPIMPVGKKEAKQIETKSATSALPIPEEVETMPSTRGFFESLPDSTELAKMKRQSIMERRAQWAKVEPTLDYVMWRFWNFMVLIVGVGGILYVLSKASATDAIHDLHGYPLIGNAITWLHISTKTVLFLILCIPTVVILGADVIRYYYTQDFSIFWLIKYALICWAWYYGFQKIIPDSPGSQGPNRMGNYPSGNGQRFLNQ